MINALMLIGHARLQPYNSQDIIERACVNMHATLHCSLTNFKAVDLKQERKKPWITKKKGGKMKYCWSDSKMKAV